MIEFFKLPDLTKLKTWFKLSLERKGKYMNCIKNVSSLTGGGGRAQQAFTMAEILLSLTIIGVVAAITLPSLTGNINERTWNTQRKALYARFSQAVALMPALNGYGSSADNAAETFVTAGLSKVLKINNICDSEHLKDCGITDKIIPFSGEVISLSNIKTLQSYNDTFISDKGIPLDFKTAAFETQNGESILVYYNPNCTSNSYETVLYYTQSNMCANFIYDLNGNKGPNTVGKDIGFISAIYPVDSIVVAPLPVGSNDSSVGTVNIGGACQRKFGDDVRAQNRHEAMSLFYNRRLIGLFSGDYWTRGLESNAGENKIWMQNFETGAAWTHSGACGHYIYCVKR